MGINKPNVRFVVHFVFRAISNPIIRKPVAPGVMAARGSDAVLRSGRYGVAAPLSEEKPQGQLQDIERHKLNAMALLPKRKLAVVWYC